MNTEFSPAQLLFRPASSAEVAMLAEIERAAQQHPWSLGQIAQSVQDDCVLVAQRGIDVVAYCVLQLVLDEASLLNVAVMPTQRRLGIARRLLQEAFAQARGRGCKRCFLEVRASNAAAIALYREQGFIFDGVRRNYYPADNGREDASLFHADW